MKMQISPIVKIGIQNEVMFVGSSSAQVQVVNTEHQKKYILVLETLLTPHTEQEVLERFPYWPDVQNIIRKLNRHKMLIKA